MEPGEAAASTRLPGSSEAGLGLCRECPDDVGAEGDVRAQAGAPPREPQGRRPESVRRFNHVFRIRSSPCCQRQMEVGISRDYRPRWPSIKGGSTSIESMEDRRRRGSSRQEAQDAAHKIAQGRRRRGRSSAPRSSSGFHAAGSASTSGIAARHKPPESGHHHARAGNRRGKLPRPKGMSAEGAAVVAAVLDSAHGRGSGVPKPSMRWPGGRGYGHDVVHRRGATRIGLADQLSGAGGPRCRVHPSRY